MKKRLLFYVLFFLVIPLSAYSLQVFPGAEGYGTDTRAAYGGTGNPTIYVVNTLADNTTTPIQSTSNGVTVYKGSLRACLLDTKYTSTGQGRIILFEISGYVDAAMSNLGLIKVNYPYVIIAGQTAPSPGISLKQAGFFIDTHDVLIQHIRIRNGTGDGKPDRACRDGITIYNYNNPNDTENIVIDHCSFAWALDEASDFGSGNGRTHDATISNSIAAESIYDPNTDAKLVSRGPLVGYGASKVSLLRNIIANNYIRNPRVATGAELLAINNYIYGYQAIGMEIGTGNALKASFINNYIKKNSQSSTNEIYIEESDPSTLVYLFGNMYENTDNSKVGPGKGVDDQWSLLTNGYANREADYKVYSSPMNLTIPVPITKWNAGDIQNNMIDNFIPTSSINTVGARPADRDAVDVRIINNVRNRTGSLIKSQDDVGGFPHLEKNTRILNIPSNPHADDDADGYTNLEEWLHKLSAQVEGRTEIGIKAPHGLIIQAK